MKDQDYLIDKIVNRKLFYATFCCSPNIHVYDEDLNIHPSPPYKLHSSLEEARKYKPNGKLIITFSHD